MKRKSIKKGFTLVELIVALSVASILLATGFKIMGITFDGIKQQNKDIDLQTEVRTSLKNVDSLVKSSRLIFFVGRSTIDPKRIDDNGYLSGIDKNFNYIVLKKDPNQGDQLVNLTYDGKKWIQIPLTAGRKFIDGNKDDVYSGESKYNISFYQGKNHIEDMENNIVNITIDGSINEGGKVQNYSLSQDIEATNVNQIMFSKSLSGSTNDITALAYSRHDIKSNVIQKGNNDTYSLVFIIDRSGSMFYGDLDGWGIGRGKESRMTILKRAMTNDSNGFLKKLNEVNVKNQEDVPPEKARVKSYFLTFDSTPYPVISDFSNPSYFMGVYSREGVRVGRTEYKVGPYNMKNADEFKNAKQMINGIPESNYPTSYGEPILDGLKILENSDSKHNYLIFLTDGLPNQITVTNRGEYFNGRNGRYSNIDKRGSDEYAATESMKYVAYVTNPSNNIADFSKLEKVFLIGYSNNHNDKKRIGYARNVSDRGSLYGCFKQIPSLRGGEESNETDRVQVLDANSEAALIDALSNIAKSIEVDMNIYDGPRDSK